MKTAAIIVRGNIRKVGYRAKVTEIVNRLGIKGEIENLKDGSVRITAQGDWDKLKEFSRQINIKNTLIRVDDISVEPFDTDKIYTDFKKVVKAKETDERLDSAVDHLKELIEVTKEGVGYSKQSVEYSKQSAGYSKQSVEYSKQSVEYSKQSVEYSKQGVELTKQNLVLTKQNLVLTKQNLELTKYGIDENKKGFSDLSDKQSQMLDKQDQASGKLDLIHKDLSVNLKAFHQDTIARFDIVDAKYGMIAQNMEKIFIEIKEERIETRETMKELIGAVLKVAEKKS